MLFDWLPQSLQVHVCVLVETVRRLLHDILVPLSQSQPHIHKVLAHIDDEASSNRFQDQRLQDGNDATQKADKVFNSNRILRNTPAITNEIRENCVRKMV